MKLTESGAKMKKSQVYWSIEGQDAQIQNQGSKWKKRSSSGLTFDFGKDAIESILKIKIANEYLIE